jgi:hypothetical protein
MAAVCRLCLERHSRHYLPFRTMSGNGRVFVDVLGITGQIEKRLIRLPDIVFSGLQTAEKAQ